MQRFSIGMAYFYGTHVTLERIPTYIIHLPGNRNGFVAVIIIAEKKKNNKNTFARPI